MVELRRRCPQRRGSPQSKRLRRYGSVISQSLHCCVGRALRKATSPRATLIRHVTAYLAVGQSRLLDYAAEAIHDTAFGLHLAQQTDPRDAGIIFYVVTGAKNLGEALSLIARLIGALLGIRGHGRREPRQAVRRRHDELVAPVAPAAGNDEAPTFARGDRQREPPCPCPSSLSDLRTDMEHTERYRAYPVKTDTHYIESRPDTSFCVSKAPISRHSKVGSSALKAVIRVTRRGVRTPAGAPSI